MKLICDEKNCTGCGACKYICPKKCIELKENCEGFLYPYIKSDACAACGLCKKVCRSEDYYEEKDKKGN